MVAVNGFGTCERTLVLEIGNYCVVVVQERLGGVESFGGEMPRLVG